MQIIEGEINPTTPEEYLEALFRLCEFMQVNWDELPNGDGESDTPDELPQTKTDLFRTISGCANCAISALKLKSMVNQI